MEKLNGLTKMLNTIKNLSTDIIEKSLPIMQELTKVNNDLLEELLEKDVKADIAIETLQNICLDLTKDAENVIENIELFSEAIIQGQDALDEGAEEYPFLLQVWYGDMYEESEIKGLELLAKDLKKQLKQIDEDKIIDKALSQLQS
uniref:Uncharacterized protein n=1 Tax=Marseillevirus LCMAC102 TaxID=2506603 RepID=A0A481YUK8_9VIRU|nr:MAG: uncharacterized protein LCMAC102_03660 [Marseillevirus LCMAC102]